MKIKFTFTIFLSMAAYCLFCSLNSGAAYSGLGDLTGSPLSTMSCAGGGCHSGGNYGTSTGIQILDSGGNAVSSYRPGSTYMLEISISSTIGSPDGYGAQAVVLDTANAQAGNLDSIQTLNTRITPWNGRQYLEQYGLNSGSLRVRWTAPAPGTGNVTVYASGIAVDGWGTMTDDEPSANVSLTLTEETGVYYDQNFYCNNNPNPGAILTGLNPGGVFNAIPPGLVFSDTLGTVDLLASDTGAYTVYYSEGGNIDSTALSILQSDWALVSYDVSNAAFYIDSLLGDSIFRLACNGLDPSPLIFGKQGGTFRTSASSLMLDSISGSISNITFAPTLITYTTNGLCSYVDSFWVERDCSVNTKKNGLNTSFSIFPNPSPEGIFYLKNDGETEETFWELYNALGQKIGQQKFFFHAGSLVEIKMPPSAPKGNYWLKIGQGSRIKTIILTK